MGQPIIRSGLIGRYRASDLDALSDGTAISSWGNARAGSLLSPMDALTQATGTKQPSKQTVAGRTVVRFDGAASGDAIAGQVWSDTPAGGFTVVVVARRIGAGQANGRLWDIKATAINYNIGTRWEYAFPVITTAANTADNWNVMTTIWTPTLVVMQANAVEVASGDPTDMSAGVATFTLGANNTQTENANVEVLDALVYNRALRLGHAKAVGRALSDHYALATIP